MAVYRFSALRDGQSVSFRATADLLNFDQSVISAADIRVTASGSNTRIEVVSGQYAGKGILLLNTTPFQLATSNLSFINGSRLLIGDNSTGQTGDNGNNSLVGTAGRDHLYGYGGNDTLNGGAGADRLDGGLGNDSYIVTAGDVIVDAGGTDTVFTTTSWSLGQGSGLENLTLTGTAAGTVLNGNELGNVLTGNNSNNASINGRAGNDTMYGMGGNDTFDMSTGGTSSYGNDYIDGGSGVDTVDFGLNARSPVLIVLYHGWMTGGGDGGLGSATLVGIENAVGGIFNDQLYGSSANNFLYGGAGNDWLVGDAGNDRLEGADGMDGIVGGAGNDTMSGGADQDNFYMYWNGADYGNDVIDGGAAHDNLVFDTFASGSAIVVDLTAGTVRGGGPSGSGSIAIRNVEGVLGTSFADRIAGSVNNEYFIGWDGNDTLDGRGGRDNLEGALGADLIVGGDGDDVMMADGRDGTLADGAVDTLIGGLGNDQFYVSSEDVISDSGGRDDVIAQESWTLGADFENLFLNNTAWVLGRGNSSNNLITAWDGDSVLEGLDGADTLMGSFSDNDTLRGGNGNDWLAGGGGLNRLEGGAGNDTLVGIGTDVFVFANAAGSANADRVDFFLSGADKLAFEDSMFTAIGGGGDFGAGDGRFHAGAGATSGHDADDRLVYDTTSGQLYYDADGAGGAAGQIVATISGAPALAASDITVI